MTEHHALPEARLIAELHRAGNDGQTRAVLCPAIKIYHGDFEDTLKRARELAKETDEKIVTGPGGDGGGTRYYIRPAEVADGSGWQGRAGAGLVRDEFDAGGFPRCVPVVEAVTDEDCYPKCTKHPRRPYTPTGSTRAAEVVLSHADAVDRAQRGAEAAQGAGTYPSAGGFTTLRPIPESLLRAGFNDDYPTEDIDVEAQIAALIELVRMTGAQRQGDGWELNTESMRRLNHGWMQLQDELTSIMRDADPPGYDGVRLKSIHDRVRWLCGRVKAAQGAGTYPAIQPDPRDEEIANLRAELEEANTANSRLAEAVEDWRNSGAAAKEKLHLINGILRLGK